jgi:hypothetical protein
MPSRPRKRVWAVVVLAVLVGLILGLPSALGSSFQLVQHGRCSTGPAVASGFFWTPIVVLDSPPSYNNSSTYALASAWAPGVAPVFLNLSNGEAGGEFSLDHWVLLPQTVQWVAGPGAVPVCPAFVGEDLSRVLGNSTGPAENFSELAPPGSTSDIDVPHMVNMSAPNSSEFPSVYFIANYSDGYSGASFGQITHVNDLGGSDGTEQFTESQVGATFFVIVQFQTSAGPIPYSTWMSGVNSVQYTLEAPWLGCIQWGGGIANPFGTGLSFGPAPSSGYACSFP